MTDVAVSNSTGNCERSSDTTKVNEKLIVYKSRWIVLMVQCLLNATNYMIFISYAPAGNYVNAYYQNRNTTNLMSTTFLVVSIPTMFIVMYFADRIGIKIVVIVSAFLNCFGVAVRTLSTVDNFGGVETKLALAIVGQAISACSNPATVILNTKVPSIWFPTSQRAVATALAATSAQLGMLIISSLTSTIVKSTSDLFELNFIVFTPAFATFLAAVIGIRKSAPPTRPSLTSNTKPLAPLTGLKEIVKNRSYMILVVSQGSGLAIFNTYYTTMEETLCGRGYDNDFSAVCTSALIVGGLIGAVVGGIIVDRTKLFDEVLKISLCVANFVGILFTEFIVRPNFSAPILLSVFLYGLFGNAYYAVGMEISAEITYPVSETMSAGIIGLVGQMLGVIYLSLWGVLIRPLPDQYKNIQKCTFSGQTLSDESLVEQDTLLSLFLFVIVGTMIAMFSVVFFKPKYQRLLEERKNRSNIENVASTTSVTKF